MTIGVLAIQGDYEAHKARLEQLGAAVTLVRKPEQLDWIDAIIIPGGESTTFLNFLEEHGFLAKLKQFVAAKQRRFECSLWQTFDLVVRIFLKVEDVKLTHAIDISEVGQETPIW